MPRILIVDDEPEMVRGLEDNLRFEGYQTIGATNGPDGLALALEAGPDLVILDITMPRMSGWAVLRDLRAKQLEVPVMAHISHLLCQQLRKGSAVGRRVVIALFLVAHQRICHLLRDNRINVVLF